MFSTSRDSAKIFCECYDWWFLYPIENPMNGMKRQKDRTLKDKLSRSVGAQYANRDW